MGALDLNITLPEYTFSSHKLITLFLLKFKKMVPWFLQISLFLIFGYFHLNSTHGTFFLNYDIGSPTIPLKFAPKITLSLKLIQFAVTYFMKPFSWDNLMLQVRTDIQRRICIVHIDSCAHIIAFLTDQLIFY